jgi:hypothetical protein
MLPGTASTIETSYTVFQIPYNTQYWSAQLVFNLQVGFEEHTNVHQSAQA